MTYFIEQKISTLARNAVGAANSADPSFELDGVTYRQWSYNRRDGWLGDAWVAEGTIEAANAGEAIMLFRNKLVKAVPMIALIGQCYIEFKRQPLLLKRSDLDFGFLDYTHDGGHVGLMFMDDHFAALQTLFANATIPDEFYKYWNDAVNTIGYSPKLLLMFSALEALVKKPNGNKDWVLLESILGTDLKDKIFTPRTGLRHRLIHGEYFNLTDTSDDYVRVIHKRIVGHFNGLLGGDIISPNTVGPQRHFFDNKMVDRFFLRPKEAVTEIRLRDVVADFEASNHHATKYDYVFDDSLTKNY
jgi:hypothetical protein